MFEKKNFVTEFIQDISVFMGHIADNCSVLHDKFRE